MAWDGSGCKIRMHWSRVRQQDEKSGEPPSNSQLSLELSLANADAESQGKRFPANRMIKDAHIVPQTTLDLQGKGFLRLGSFADAATAKRSLSVPMWMPGDRIAHSTSSLPFRILTLKCSNWVWGVHACDSGSSELWIL